jgi:hypothetical protein
MNQNSPKKGIVERHRATPSPAPISDDVVVENPNIAPSKVEIEVPFQYGSSPMMMVLIFCQCVLKVGNICTFDGYRPNRIVLLHQTIFVQRYYSSI